MRHDMKKKKILFITRAAVTAAVYIVLTLLSGAFGLSGGIVQVRLSEALTVLPYFTASAIPGLFVGCLVGNMLTGCLPWDIVFGSAATLIGAVGTYLLRRFKWAAPLPPIIANTLIIPFVLRLVYNVEGSVPFFMVTVGAGEIISCGICGMLLLMALGRYRNVMFKD